VAATVTTGVLATAIGAASFLASDQAKIGRVNAATLHGDRVSRTANPSTVAAASTASSTAQATPAAAAPDLVWAEKARSAPVTPQPASTYDAPDDGTSAPASTSDAPPPAPETPDPAADPATMSAAPDPAPQGRPAFVKPTQGVFTSGFGRRDGAFHYGIDLANRMGTPEVAVANAVVLQAGPASGFGLWVRLRLDDGTVVVYGHMDQILVRQGQRVAAGQEIATMGMRGQATGPHLHFEVWVNGSASKKINPLPWLAARGIRV
jgi:murein DD-endopeptidase MepM/ murein hydrolase activator NlpD